MNIEIQNRISTDIQQAADLILEADSFLERIGDNPSNDDELFHFALLRLRSAKEHFIKGYTAAIEIGGRRCK